MLKIKFFFKYIVLQNKLLMKKAKLLLLINRSIKNILFVFFTGTESGVYLFESKVV